LRGKSEYSDLMAREYRRVEKFHSEELCNWYPLLTIIRKFSACCMNVLTCVINLVEQGKYTVLVSKIRSSCRIFNVASLCSYALSVKFCVNVDLPLSNLSVIYVCDVLGKLTSVLNTGPYTKPANYIWHFRSIDFLSHS
jgi:hypothetical protein